MRKVREPVGPCTTGSSSRHAPLHSLISAGGTRVAHVKADECSTFRVVLGPYIAGASNKLSIDVQIMHALLCLYVVL